LSIVKSTSISQSKTSSAAGSAGTLPWMAPELFNGKPNSKQTDVYSLGIVLWEIISRETPFKDKMQGIIVGMVLAGNRETLPEKCPELFRLMIIACWDQEPKKRPNAQQVGYQFETALKSLEGLPSSLPSKGNESKKEIKPNLPGMSSSSQTLMPTPTRQTNPDQLKLQDQLIVACKQADEKAVTALLSRGAKPDILSTKGEHPLGAAVWSMCLNVVSTLLKQAGSDALLTWDECEKHNFKHYQEVFSVSKFEPQTYGEWTDLLLTINSNLFLRNLHLKKISIPLNVLWKGAFDKRDLSEWERLGKYVKNNAVDQSLSTDLSQMRRDREWCRMTEQSFLEHRIQIKQLVETSKKPIEAKKELPSLKTAQIRQILMPIPKSSVSIEQLKLQNNLIEACRQGDEKRVKELLIQGAKSNIPDAKGEQPLGAAVWGMCPDVVNALLQQADNIALMTWEECKKHNLERYGNLFIVP
ncbi:MAG: protein kinase, partial [Proteobacteria bacterium]|nr:protein kinase [Pseudomonadota bacterium]